ncbi:hypothetical protein PSFL_02780 [Pseudomonas sp. DD1]|uniref:DUF6414 family protein n=1 Tax=Pseudomonas sp. DD1 TaxID=879558 RepID=UPI0037CA9C65
MKSFVYLDEYKMYSLSSQIMEGVTDFVLKESRNSSSDSEEQKGPVASGKRMAEIIETASASLEKRFLHDYAFSLFEEKLTELKKIVFLSGESSFDDVALDKEGRRIVRVRAKANFLDAADLLKSLDTLVDMQEALSIVAANDRREEILIELEALGVNANKKALISSLKGQLEKLSKSLISRDKIANDRLQYKNLSSVLEHGYKGRLDLRMTLKDVTITTDLKRSCLKDPEDFIFKTYSRVASVELVLLGVVTQLRGLDGEAGSNESNFELPNPTLSEVVVNSTKALHELEEHFHRVEGKQIVIDPIALYLEI